MDESKEAAEARARKVADCLARAEDWRQEAKHLRDRAAQPHLAPDESATLLREALAADRMTFWWVKKAEEADG